MLKGYLPALCSPELKVHENRREVMGQGHILIRALLLQVLLLSH